MEEQTSLGIDVTINSLIEGLTLEHNQSNNSPGPELNDDCLAHIFSYLPMADRVRAERVCKQWQAVIQQSWNTVKKLDLSKSKWCLPKTKRKQHIDSNMLKKIIHRCGKYLKYLDLRFHNGLLDTDALMVVSTHCPNLKCLDLSHFSISSRLARDLSDRCHNLAELSLGECRQSCENNLSRLFFANENLRHLSINTSIDISGECLTYLPSEVIEQLSLHNCRNMESYWLNLSLQRLIKLTSLSLTWCSNIDDSTLKIIGELKTITRLTFYPDTWRPLSVTAMLNFAKLINLELLNIQHKSLVTDDLITELSINCKRLKILHITNCESVTNTGVIALFKNAQNLTFLTLVGTSVNYEILQEADEIFKRRKNNELTIFYARKDASEPEFFPTSSFLQIVYEEF